MTEETINATTKTEELSNEKYANAGKDFKQIFESICKYENDAARINIRTNPGEIPEARTPSNSTLDQFKDETFRFLISDVFAKMDEEYTLSMITAENVNFLIAIGAFRSIYSKESYIDKVIEKVGIENICFLLLASHAELSWDTLAKFREFYATITDDTTEFWDVVTETQTNVDTDIYLKYFDEIVCGEDYDLMIDSLVKIAPIPVVEKAIEKYPDDIYWGYVSQNPNLTLEFIEKYKYLISFDDFFAYNRGSLIEEYIEKYGEAKLNEFINRTKCKRYSNDWKERAEWFKNPDLDD